MKIIIFPSWYSMRRPLGWFLFIDLTLSLGALSAVYFSPRGIDFQAIIFFFGIPIAVMFIPILIIFLSFRIQLNPEKLILYKFFIPIKMIPYDCIKTAKYEKISSRGQACVLTIFCDKEKYSYPIRLFSERKVALLIDYLNKQITEKEFVNKLNIIESVPIQVTAIAQPLKHKNSNVAKAKHFAAEAKKDNNSEMKSSIFSGLFNNMKRVLLYWIVLVAVIIIAVYCNRL